MQHKIASNFETECRLEVTPEKAGWKYLSFYTYGFGRGHMFERNTADSEVCIVFLEGDAVVEVADRRWNIEGRKDVFAGLPYSVYLPPDQIYRITFKSAAEIAIGSAPAEGKLKPRLIPPEEVKVEIRGGHNVTRQISHILDPGDAEKLLCVEVYTPSGNWSSYPPHKHDVHSPPHEVYLEEIYYYCINPPNGWAMQRLYTDDRSLNEIILAHDGDVILVRQGYHPVVAAPGYDVYYLNFLAGEEPSWTAKDDPQLAWVRGSWEGREARLKLPLQGRGR